MSSDNPYEKFQKSEKILRDELAIDRTVLANERTVLAYLRTSLTLLIAGLSFIHFVEAGILRTLGFVFIPASIIIGIYGLVRFNKMNKMIQTIRTKNNCGTSE